METEGKSLVIDTGPDFRMQMLRADIHQLDAVIYTHEHKDHTAGLDDIRPFNFRQKKDMPVYGRSQVLNQIRQEYSYVFFGEKNTLESLRFCRLKLTKRHLKWKGLPSIPFP